MGHFILGLYIGINIAGFIAILRLVAKDTPLAGFIYPAIDDLIDETTEWPDWTKIVIKILFTLLCFPALIIYILFILILLIIVLIDITFFKRR